MLCTQNVTANEMCQYMLGRYWHNDIISKTFWYMVICVSVSDTIFCTVINETL